MSRRVSLLVKFARGVVLPHLHIMERFWEKVKKTDTCWIWTAAKSRGYGCYYKDGKNRRAHRISFEDRFGSISQTSVICHNCDNPACVNPDHLFLGTQSDNMKDAFRKKRIVIPAGKRFEKDGYHPKRKLSRKEVDEIKLLPSKNLRSVAQKYGVDYSRIWQIINKS